MGEGKGLFVFFVINIFPNISEHFHYFVKFHQIVQANCLQQMACYE